MAMTAPSLPLPRVRESVERTHRLIIFDESTYTGGVGATISAAVYDHCYDELDAPIVRVCMGDGPVPYATTMEPAVVRRAADLTQAVKKLINNQ